MLISDRYSCRRIDFWPVFPFKEAVSQATAWKKFFFRESVKMNPHIIEEMHPHPPEPSRFLPTVMMAVGFVVSWLFYLRRPYVARPSSPGEHPDALPVPAQTNGISTSSTI